MIRQLCQSSVRSVTAVGLFALVTVASAQTTFEFKHNDHIAILGSGLAERLQHDGWLETVLQDQMPEKNLVVRNMAFPGDSVGKMPRSSGFMSIEQYLTHTSTDVIFMMFGYNESFGGEAKLSEFKDNLAKTIDTYRALKPNGDTEPRFVLFSPIAHENLRTPNLPDGSENNQRLAMYSQAIKSVADEKEVMFVDLFGPTQKLYDKLEEPLTINGTHLNEAGNRELAKVIAGELLGTKVEVSDGLEGLRQAVIDKNWHWFHRYRATDGNDVWGGRSRLTFVNDQTNREVLQHELHMIDIMTANRDAVIWARANGRDLKVDDSNVPGPVPVISNVGGGSASSSAMKEGSLVYLDGEEAIEKMTVPDGFKVNLFADERRFPELANPVQMAVDPKGRLWVAAWKTYPKWEPLKEMNDRLLIMPDEDRDGVADKVIEFAKVHNPTGFEFWNGGVLVASQPDILFLKDTDGDDVADVRYVYLQGIGSADTHHAANAFVYGPDGGIYWQSGIFLVNNIENPYGPSLNTGNSGMFRFDPRRFTIDFHARNDPNPHGISFDKWGYHFANDGTGGRSWQVRPDGHGFKMYELLKMQVRPVAANGVISSANFPDEMQNNFILCNTIGFLGIKQYKLDRDGGAERKEVQGRGSERKEVTVTTRLGEVWGEPAEDLLVSTDKNFRPSDVEFGSDGAMYVSDWQNVIIGHMQHNVRDPNRDHEHGRIYRIVNTRKPLQEPVDIAGASLDQLMKNLEHPVDGVRYRTRIELSGRDTDEVIAAANKWMEKFDPKKREDAHHLLEGLWLHQQHNVRNPQLLAKLLESPEPNARVAAQTVQHYYYHVNARADAMAAPKRVEPTETPAPTPAPQKSGIISDTADLTEIRIGTVVEKMRYDVTEITVKAGKKLRVTFANADFMPHNIVFVKPGTADKVGMAAMQLGAKGFEMQFVPENENIIIASRLVDNGKDQVLAFTAPATPGDYQFVCTFPGHHLLMRGVLKVR